jgi:prenyltransferase beta subunit
MTRSTRARLAACAATSFATAVAVLALLSAVSRSAAALTTPYPDEITAASGAFAWLRTQQNADGSITSFSMPGTAGAVGDTAETIFAARALGIAPSTVTTNSGRSLLSPLGSPALAQYLTGSVNSVARIALGAAAADLDPRALGGYDLVVSMTNYYSPTTGAFSNGSWEQASAMLAWAASGEAIPPTATNFLASRIGPDGGFEYAPGFGTDSNTTGLVIQALVAGGRAVTSTEVISALAYLRNTQESDGGWSYDGSGTSSDANSTAYAVQGLIAAGQDPLNSPWQTGSANPIVFLRSLQQPDGGIAYTGTVSNRSATIQAIPALLGKTAPYYSRAVVLRKARAFIAAQQMPSGAFNGFGTGSTIDALNAYVAAGGNLSTLSNTVPYLAAQQAYPGTSAAAAGKFAVGTALIGRNPANFEGMNLVISMTSKFSSTTGRYGSSVWDQSWTLLGLTAAGEPISPTQVQQLISITATGGGYGFFANADAGDPDSTGLALMALRAAGVPITNTVVQNSLEFLRSAWLADTANPSVDSAGLAAQGLCAYGEDPRDLRSAVIITANATSRIVFSTPMDTLLASQEQDGGFKTPYSRPVASYAGTQGVACQPLPVVKYQKTSPRIFLPLASRN